jgi:hypothetical protein
MSDDPKEMADYLERWLELHGKQADLVPDVQRAKEIADWQSKTWAGVKAHLPPEARKHLERTYEEQLGQLRLNLPLPTEYSRYAFSALATGTSSSSMSTYHGILSAAQAGFLGEDVASEHLTSYQQIMDRQSRESTVRSWLLELFPRLSTPFDQAVRARLTAQSQPDQVFAAAQAIRTLLEQFKGQLLERARTQARENMTWAEMTDRLVPASKPANEREVVRNQEKQHGHIFDRLSKIAKWQSNAGPTAVDRIWPLVIDHLYVICAAIRESA